MERGTLYPAWVYHRTEAPRIVNSAAEDDALGPDWSNTPATFADPAAEPAEVEDIADAPKKRGRKPKA